MKTYYLAFLLLTLFINTSAQNFKEYYLKFDIYSKSELNEITRIISIDKVINHSVYAYATDKSLEKFKQLGYKYTLLEHPGKGVKENLATTMAEMEHWDKYPTYDLYVEMMNYYETTYPDICKVINLGSTVNGRALLALKISDNIDTEENEPEFFYTSTMHGDETTGFVLMLRLADSLLTSYGIEPEITNLVNEIEIYINPNANPDGTYRSDNNTISYPTRSNANGVDLNRNFPDPANGDHPDGHSWQPETEAMMNFAKNQRIVMSANFHGGVELANYPWDHTSRRHPDDSWFINVSRDYATLAQNNSPSGYFTGEDNGITNGADWYVVYGSRQDYYTYFHNSREVTMEISDSKFVAGSSLPNYWNYNKEALLQFMSECLYGIRGIVQDIDDEPLDAMIFIESHDTDLDSSMVFTDSDLGDYHRMIDEGTYNIIASSNGYINDTIKNIIVASNSTVTANFVLQKKNTYNISGTITNAGTGEPVENAEITIIGNSSSSVFSNNEGIYSIDNIPEGNHQVSLSKNGFTKKYSNISITEQDTIFNFQLFAADIEDFETGNFSKLNWQFTGSANWIIDNVEFFEGSNAAKSGAIDHNNKSTMFIDTTFKNGGVLSFYKKVSSESGYDYLKFYIDNQLQDKWSGDDDWSYEEYLIDNGEHTIKWEYTKDSDVSSGDDCAWIDYISFPKFKEVIDSVQLDFSPLFITDTLFYNDSVQHQIIITNTSEAIHPDYTISIDNEDNHQWITLNKNSGTLLNDNPDTVTVTLRTSPMISGPYSCDILLVSEDLDIDTIPVYLTIRDTIESMLSIHEISDTITTDTIKNYPIIITNIGRDQINYSLSENEISGYNWLSYDKESGQIPVNGKDTIIVHVNSNELDPGIYQAFLTFTEQDGDEKSITISINVKSPVNVYDLQNVSPLVKLYPNPFTEFLNIDVNSQFNDDFLIKIFNIQGQKLYEGKYKNTKKVSLNNLNQLLKGIYIIQIVTADSIQSEKIVKK
ncbi:MAG: M14 family zinc carboxypeptidase [Bacteroidales bacterium]